MELIKDEVVTCSADINCLLTADELYEELLIMYVQCRYIKITFKVVINTCVIHY